MKHILIFVYIAMILVATSWGAGALTLSSVEGDWTGTTGGSNVRYNDDVSIGYGNGLEDRIMWGQAASRAGQSGLGFTGAASASSPMTFALGDAFSFGQLRHFNNPIFSGTAASEAFLNISMDFSDPGGLSNVFDFTFAIDETPNAPGPPASDDRISIPGAHQSQIFEYAGIVYTFEFLGFGDSADHLISSFTSPEGTTNATELWGKITASNPVPEPGTMLLLGVGLLGAANVARRRVKDAPA